MFVRNSKMNLVTCWQFLVIHLTLISASEQFVSLDCKNENHAVHGKQSLLECIVKPMHGIEITIIAVNWKRLRDDVTLLEYNRKIPALGLKFADPDWNNNLNVSMLLTNTKMKDDGEYECIVQTDSGTDTGKVSLSVTAMRTPPVMSSIPENNIEENTAVTIFCNTTGQKGMIWWFNMLDQNCTNDAELKTERNKDGLFILSSKLTVQSVKSHNSKYTCIVLNITGVEEGTKSIQLHFDRSSWEPNLNKSQQGKSQDTASIAKWLAPVVVIGALIIGLLTALLVCRRRTQKRPNDHSIIFAYGVEAGTGEIEDLNSKG